MVSRRGYSKHRIIKKTMIVTKVSRKGVVNFNISEDCNTYTESLNFELDDNLDFKNDNDLLDRKKFSEKRQIELKNIIGRDDRSSFSVYNYPYNLVGQIKILNIGSATGVLIGPKHVLTCFHNVSKGLDGKLNSTYFIPAFHNGRKKGIKEPYGRFIVVDAYYPGGQRRNSNSHEYSSVDYAILVLKSEPDLGGFASCIPYQPCFNNISWKHIGYPRDYGIPFIQHDVKISQSGNFIYNDMTNNRISGIKYFTNADAEQGQSGGPLLIFTTENNGILMKISGILSAIGTTDSGFAGINDYALKFVNYIITNT